MNFHSHPVLKNVFAKEIGKIAEVYWLFRANILKQNRWENSWLILYKKYKERNLVFFIANKLIELMMLLKAIQLIVTLKTDIVFIRDRPFTALFITPMKLFHKFKIYLHYNRNLYKYGRVFQLR